MLPRKSILLSYGSKENRKTYFIKKGKLNLLIFNHTSLSSKLYHCVPYTSTASPVLVFQNKRSYQNKNEPNIFLKKDSKLYGTFSYLTKYYNSDFLSIIVKFETTKNI
jgi:hypothetical protein